MCEQRPDDPTTGPPDPTARVVWQLGRQALSCAAMGSPLSAFLLQRAAVDVLEGGPCASLLLRDVRPGRGDAVALRFLAALHRLVLDRRAPLLALHYPTVGGTPDLRTVGDALVATVAAHVDGDLPGLVARPCQTNEVGRAAGLVVGLLAVASVTDLPLRLLEIGASAGLNLRLDRFAYEVPMSDGGTRTLGPDGAEVVLADAIRAPLPGDPTGLPSVVDRRGCDLQPIDPGTPEGRARVSASVWADQVERFARLGAALRTAARVPAVVDERSAGAWLRERLREPVPGSCALVMQSVVREYLPASEQRAVEEALVTAGERAREDAPVAHLAMEPLSALRRHGVTVRMWPHAPEPRLVATCGAHGTDVTPR